MKINFKLVVSLFMLSTILFLPPLNADSAESQISESAHTISMDFQDASLPEILKILSIQSGMNFIASEAVQSRKISLYLDKVPLEKAMENIFKANNLACELDKEANIFIVKDWGKPQIETITQIFYLKHATVSSSSIKEEMFNQIRIPSGVTTKANGSQEARTRDGKWGAEEESGITKAVKRVLSSYGSVIEDFRTNSLIVTDVPSRMPTIASTIAALDVPVPQVMLEVEMLDVSKNTMDKIGIKWGDITDFPHILTMNFSPLPHKTNPFADGSLDFSTSSYRTFLNFITAQVDTKYLARPRLLTLNNETAEIKIATQEAIGEQLAYSNDGNISARTAERTETGVSLRVTPQINLDRNEITMFIVPRVTETIASALSDSYRDPEERGTKSLVKVKDGDTIIVGGLIRNESVQTMTKVPLLGDMPLLGGLFRHKNREKGKERELLVFITPHIVKDADVDLAQLQNITLPAREQNSISGFDRQRLISNSLHGFEKKK